MVCWPRALSREEAPPEFVGIQWDTIQALIGTVAAETYHIAGEVEDLAEEMRQEIQERP